MHTCICVQKGWNIFHRACSVKEDQSVGDHKCLLQWLIETIPDSILTDEEKSELVKQKTAVCVRHVVFNGIVQTELKRCCTCISLYYF